MEQLPELALEPRVSKVLFTRICSVKARVSFSCSYDEHYSLYNQCTNNTNNQPFSYTAKVQVESMVHQWMLNKTNPSPARWRLKLTATLPPNCSDTFDPGVLGLGNFNNSTKRIPHLVPSRTTSSLCLNTRRSPVAI